MTRLQGEKLLRYSFTENELNALLQNKEFMERANKVETTDDFEQLCILGFNWLTKENKLQEPASYWFHELGSLPDELAAKTHA